MGKLWDSTALHAGNKVGAGNAAGVTGDIGPLFRMLQLIGGSTALLNHKGQVNLRGLDFFLLRANRPLKNSFVKIPKELLSSRLSWGEASEPDAGLHNRPRGTSFPPGQRQRAKFCFMGPVLMENHQSLIITPRLTAAAGTAERDAAEPPGWGLSPAGIAQR
jgi:hypothetical protein